jgi:hypothetical protein
MAQVQLALPDYLKAIRELPANIVLRFDNSLDDDESGHTVPIAGKQCIIVNAKHSVERQRFTACHEIGHIVLQLRTEHEVAEHPFARRSASEALCDVFAAEMLLPRPLVRPQIEDSDLSFASIERLSRAFQSSLSATGSRFTAMCDRPCAFVLIKSGAVRFASLSRSMKECGAWIALQREVPERSLAFQLARSRRVEGPIPVEAIEWLSGWKRGGHLLEDARHSRKLDLTLSLLWFEDDRVPTAGAKYADDDYYDDLALKPLDGTLPWPGRRGR